MMNLQTETTKRYYFIKDNIIFDIKSVYNGTDSCVVVLGGDASNETLPFIEVKDKKNYENKKYFLDIFISDGDSYDGEKFKKTKHDIELTEESSIYFCNYYKELCEEAIKNGILKYYGMKYEWFKENIDKLGVPSYMIKSENYEISSLDDEDFEAIDFSEEYFNTAKEEAVADAALKAANTVANKYNYKVNLDELPIVKI